MEPIFSLVIAILDVVIQSEVNHVGEQASILPQRIMDEGSEELELLSSKLEQFKTLLPMYSIEKQFQIFKRFLRFKHMIVYCEKNILVLFQFENTFIIENQDTILHSIVFRLFYPGWKQIQARIESISATIFKNKVSLLILKKKFVNRLVSRSSEQKAYQIIRCFLKKGMRIQEEDFSDSGQSFLRCYLQRQSRIHRTAFPLLSYYSSEIIKRKSPFSKLALLPEHLIRHLIMVYF